MLRKKIYIAIYRAIVFNLSSYIGSEFIDELDLHVLDRNRSGRFSGYNQKYHFDNDFCEITERILNEGYRHYMSTLIWHSDFTKVKTKADNYLNEYAKKFRGITCDYRTMFLYLLVLINEVRYYDVKSVLPSIPFGESVKFITIEDLQYLLQTTYMDEKDEHINDLLTICICTMLGQGMISNEICYDPTGTVYRGFKYGTNSEALLDLSAKIFYVALKTYYDKCMQQEIFNLDKESIYAKKFEKFMAALRRFLGDYQLNGSVVTTDELKLYQEFFKERNSGKLRKIIENKTFIADDAKQPYYLEKLKERIELLDIYDG